MKSVNDEEKAESVFVPCGHLAQVPVWSISALRLGPGACGQLHAHRSVSQSPCT